MGFLTRTMHSSSVELSIFAITQEVNCKVVFQKCQQEYPYLLFEPAFHNDFHSFPFLYTPSHHVRNSGRQTLSSHDKPHHRYSSGGFVPVMTQNVSWHIIFPWKSFSINVRFGSYTMNTQVTIQVGRSNKFVSTKIHWNLLLLFGSVS